MLAAIIIFLRSNTVDPESSLCFMSMTGAPLCMAKATSMATVASGRGRPRKNNSVLPFSGSLSGMLENVLLVPALRVLTILHTLKLFSPNISLIAFLTSRIVQVSSTFTTKDCGVSEVLCLIFTLTSLPLLMSMPMRLRPLSRPSMELSSKWSGIEFSPLTDKLILEAGPLPTCFTISSFNCLTVRSFITESSILWSESIMLVTFTLMALLGGRELHISAIFAAS
mmetsp:Transcript_69232/g.174508  ORF Transcript_69232/g.174508 Transcript_69232/m.174508 type:complete len:225 (-) Transcript_69232:2821-3495(-)